MIPLRLLLLVLNTAITLHDRWVDWKEVQEAAKSCRSKKCFILCVFHMASGGIWGVWGTYLQCALVRTPFSKMRTFSQNGNATYCGGTYVIFVKSVHIPFAFHMMTLELLKNIPCLGFGWPFQSHFAPMLTSFHKLWHHSYFLLLLSKPLVYA